MATAPAPVRLDGRSERWRVHREERRDQLVQATVLALDRFGPEVSLEQIASVAEMPKPKIYRYFEDRSALIDAVGDWLRSAVSERVEAVAEAEATIRDGLGRSLRALYDLMDEHPSAFALLRTRQHAEPGASPVLPEVVRRAARPLLALLNVPGGTGDDAESTVQMVVSSVLGAGDWWLGQPRDTRIAVDRLVENLTRALIGAVEAVVPTLRGGERDDG